MREIKFRAWDKAKNWMCFFGPEFDMDDDYNFLAFLTPKNIAGPLGDHNSMERYVLMQYTGLKDKTGKEIYEGDILSVTSCKDPVVVKWEIGSIGASDESAGFYIGDGVFGMEVIGNIHEHEHLLKKD